MLNFDIHCYNIDDFHHIDDDRAILRYKIPNRRATSAEESDNAKITIHVEILEQVL